MAKVSSIEKNENRRRLVEKFSKRRSEAKQIVMKRDTPPEERFAMVTKLAKLPRNSAPNRVRNRCKLTGRPRGYYRKFKLSRIAFREQASFGNIPGLIKSSW